MQNTVTANSFLILILSNATQSRQSSQRLYTRHSGRKLHKQPGAQIRKTKTAAGRPEALREKSATPSSRHQPRLSSLSRAYIHAEQFEIIKHRPGEQPRSRKSLARVGRRGAPPSNLPSRLLNSPASAVKIYHWPRARAPHLNRPRTRIRDLLAEARAPQTCHARDNVRHLSGAAAARASEKPRFNHLVNPHKKARGLLMNSAACQGAASGARARRDFVTAAAGPRFVGCVPRGAGKFPSY